MAPSLSHAGPMVSLSRAQALVELERILAATFTHAQLVSWCAELYGEDFALSLRAIEEQSATFLGESVGLLVRGPLDERLLLSLLVANPALRPEVQGVARGLGFVLSETAIRAFTTPDYELPPSVVELALVDLRDQRRRVAEAFHGPITALVALRLQGHRDREALHAAAEALRAWAATNLEHVALTDVREALESFVALVPVDPATSLKPFLAAGWLPRIAALRQLVQLTGVELGRLAAWAPAKG